jgi:hypothetical protein
MAATISPIDEAFDEAWLKDPSNVSVIKAVTRRLVPYLVEATLIPMVLFYVLLITLELKWAVIAGLGYTFTALGRRIVTRRRVPGLLVLATLGVSVRSMIFLFNENRFVYFFQPILRTVATAALFALSVLAGRPLIARFAADFVPLTADIQSRPAVDRLFRRLTYLWAGVNATAAAISLTLLLTVPMAVYVGTATVAAWILTCSGVVLTVSDALRTARGEGLHTAVLPNGRLHAYLRPPIEDPELRVVREPILA